MTSLLTAHFSNRDMADLAVMRLRYSGIAFSVSRITDYEGTRNSEHQNSLISLQYPTGNSFTNALGGIPGAYHPPVGARVFTGHSAARDRGGTILQIRVLTKELDRAKEILKSAHAVDIWTDRQVSQDF